MAIRKPKPKLHVRLPAVVAGGVIVGVIGLGVVAGGEPSYGGAIREQRRAVTRDAATPLRAPDGGDVLLCARRDGLRERGGGGSGRAVAT